MTVAAAATAKEEDTIDDRGIRFGTAVAYEDAYSGLEQGGFVDSLPTEEEERERHFQETDDDLLDEGRVVQSNRHRAVRTYFMSNNKGSQRVTHFIEQAQEVDEDAADHDPFQDRKSTRLNSSHVD